MNRWCLIELNIAEHLNLWICCGELMANYESGDWIQQLELSPSFLCFCYTLRSHVFYLQNLWYEWMKKPTTDLNNQSLNSGPSFLRHKWHNEMTIIIISTVFCLWLLCISYIREIRINILDTECACCLDLGLAEAASANAHFASRVQDHRRIQRYKSVQITKRSFSSYEISCILTQRSEEKVKQRSEGVRFRQHKLSGWVKCIDFLNNCCRRCNKLH